MLSLDKLTDHSLLFCAIRGCSEMESQEDSRSFIIVSFLPKPLGRNGNFGSDLPGGEIDYFFA